MVEDLSEASVILVSRLRPEPQPLRFGVSPKSSAAIIVAHPDDETLWAGGTLLTLPAYNWFIITICRKSDPDRSRKFFDVVQSYGASGAMADLDDSPEQIPLANEAVQQAILQLLPPLAFDLVLTHAPDGEYTRHIRHEEVSQAVLELWKARAISAKELWMFAYEDDHGERLPTAIETAHHFTALPEAVYAEKYRLITAVYGFSTDSWEARTTPQNEAFWCFESPRALQSWMERSGDQR